MEKKAIAKDELTAAKIAEVVIPLLDELFSENQIQIISEPGRYFVEAAFALCSRIYSVHEEWVGGCQSITRHYYIAQGVQGVFKDVILCGEEFIPLPLRTKKLEEDNSTQTSCIHGPSGEDHDIVCRDCQLPKLDVGDWLIFDRVGAYTLSIASRSGNQPIRYVIGGTSS